MTGILVDAVRHARHAPSIFNTQPWQWHIGQGEAELRADPSRWLEHTDPNARMLLLSCGAAIHHAAVAVRAQGWDVDIARFPDGAAGPLARIRLVSARGRYERLAAWLRAGWWQGRPPATETGFRPGFGFRTGTPLRTRPTDGPEPEELAAAIARRRTDRRAFGPQPIDDKTLAELRRAVVGQGAGLHFVRKDAVPLLAALTARASAEAANHPWQVAELTHWTHRPTTAGDGVPATTAVQDAPRRVPIRDFAATGTPHSTVTTEKRRQPAPTAQPRTQPADRNARAAESDARPAGIAGLDVGEGSDAGATYAVIFGTGDTPADWLRAGEALSALLLTATARNVASAPMSEVIETPRTRELLAGLIGGGRPYLVVRLGHATNPAPLPPAPRRRPDATITGT
ncbi:nitroreductase [Actinoplanes sp. NPDC051861]|uniref:nitroreductase n=1 Tax=Actinoplanes sp. NPDC051861 TaxID=3155170 RepID=UPI003425C25A